MLGLVNLQQTLIDAGEVALVAFVNDCGQLLFRMAGLKVYLSKESKAIRNLTTY